MIPYNCIVIGAGSIGAIKPLNIDSPHTKNILTHAHAIKANNKLKLYGIVETDVDKRMEAARRWMCEPAKSISVFSSQYDAADIVVVAVPTEYHLRIIKEICEWKNAKGIKILVMEKPFGKDLEEAEKIVSLCKQHIPQAKIVVDYSRRFSELYLLGMDINNGIYGKIYSASCLYVRGLLRDGCHAIDLFNLMFGKCTYAKKIGPIGFDDYSKDDRTDFVSMSYDKCKYVSLIPHDGRAYDIFEIDIHTDQGRLRIVEHGKMIFRYYIEKEKTFGNYNSISAINIETSETKLENFLPALYNQCVSYLNNPKKNFIFNCTEEDALNVHRVYNMMKGQA